MRNDWSLVPHGPYEINSEGMVRSINRVVCKADGTRARYKGRMLRRFLNSSGYWCVHLRDATTGMSVVVRCHRLVAMSFIPNPNKYPEVNHIDGNKRNSDVSNLEWVTPYGNRKHAWDTGLRTPAMLPVKRGSANGSSKLSEDQVIALRHDRTDGVSYGCLAKKYGVSKKTCMDIVARRSWAWLLPPLPPAPEKTK